MSHGRVVRPGGHGRSGTEPVRGVRHLATRGQVTVSHGRVVHVGRGRGGAGQTIEVGLVQVRVVHDDALSRTVISSGGAHVRIDDDTTTYYIIILSTIPWTMQLLHSRDNCCTRKVCVKSWSVSIPVRYIL